MSFLAWTFLFGGLAVAGPIVAHLLSKPRFRRVPFTMLRFLRRGQSHSHSRRRLRDLLILLIRCAIIVLIAILFAQPVLLVKAEPTPRKSLYHFALDDSISMAYRDGSTTLFEWMTEKAIARIRQAPDDAAFNIYGLASGRSGQGLTKSQAIAEVKRLAPMPASVHLDGLFSAVRQADSGAASVAILLSDFTPETLRKFEQVQEPVAVDDVQFESITPEGPAQNTAILGAHLAGVSGDTLNLDVTVCHWGPVQRQCTLTARVADTGTVCKQELSLLPARQSVARMQIKSHWQGGACLPVELGLSPADGLAEDNAFRLGVHIPQSREKKVLVVHKGEETFLFETALQALADSGSLEKLSIVRVQGGRLTSRDLDGADVVVFPSLPQSSSYRVGDLRAFAQGGGTLLFFTAESQDPGAASQLAREGLLPAQPQRYVPGIVYPEPRASAGVSLALDAQAARSLCNYRLDRIALKGHWQCAPTGQTQCLWRLNNGQGFIHAIPCGNGLSILVNTSIDDSLGLLAKSSAWVAFCRYLLGGNDSIRQYSFCASDRPELQIADAPARNQRMTVSVENCDGGTGSVQIQGNMLQMPAPTGLGWMKATLSAAHPGTPKSPVLYAGINLPVGETDLTAPGQEAVAAAMWRAFVIDDGADRYARSSVGTAHPAGLERRPIWRYFAWVAILLLVLESTVANRLKR